MRPLEVDGIAKRYGRGDFQLQPTSFSVGKGEVLAVLGLNGAGKSTLLRIIAGTVLADAGSVTIGGRTARAGTPSPGLSVVLDGGRSLYWKMSVAENIDYFGALRGAGWRGRRERLAETLVRAGLSNKANGLVGTLSRGMQQRLVLAIALMTRPSVLLLDEPTLGVDLVHEALIAESIFELKAQGCAIVLTSHQLEFIDRLADRALLLDAGRGTAPQAMSELRAALGHKTFELELRDTPFGEVVTRLVAIGADVHDRQVRVEADDTTIYGVLDAIRPLPIVSCGFSGADLRSIMSRYHEKEAA